MGLERTIGKEFLSLKPDERDVLEQHTDFFDQYFYLLPQGADRHQRHDKIVVLKDLSETLKGYSDPEDYIIILSERAQKLSEETVDLRMVLGQITDTLLEYLTDSGQIIDKDYVYNQQKTIRKAQDTRPKS